MARANKTMITIASILLSIVWGAAQSAYGLTKSTSSTVAGENCGNDGGGVFKK